MEIVFNGEDLVKYRAAFPKNLFSSIFVLVNPKRLNVKSTANQNLILRDLDQMPIFNQSQEYFLITQI